MQNMEIVFKEGGYESGYYNCFFCGQNFKLQLIDPLLIVVKRGKIIGHCCLTCLTNDPKKSLLLQASQLEKTAADLQEVAMKMRKIAMKTIIKSVTAEEYFEFRDEIAEHIYSPGEGEL